MKFQRHLAWNEAQTDERPRFCVLDESSLASTKQMHTYLHRLDAHDRLLLVGDARQHQAIDAGRPYEQLQDAGVSVAHLTEIVRQRAPALKDVVRELSNGDVGRAMQALDKQGRIHEIAEPQECYRGIAREYASIRTARWWCHQTTTHAGTQSGDSPRATAHGTRRCPRPGVTVYREAERAFANGDRVQFTAPDRTRHIANRELGRVESIGASGDVRLRLDSGRSVAFAVRDHPHRDHGYAVTRHSSQGQTTDRVIVHIDSDRNGERLLNRLCVRRCLARATGRASLYQ